MRFFSRKHDEAQPDAGRAVTVRVDGDIPAAAETGAAGFGYKIAWLAIRTDDTRSAAEALGLSDVRAASWAEGVAAALAILASASQASKPSLGASTSANSRNSSPFDPSS